MAVLFSAFHQIMSFYFLWFFYLKLRQQQAPVSMLSVNTHAIAAGSPCNRAVPRTHCFDVILWLTCNVCNCSQPRTVYPCPESLVFKDSKRRFSINYVIFMENVIFLEFQKKYEGTFKSYDRP